MQITLTMTARELDTALSAVEQMADNEHDKGEREADGLWQGQILETAMSDLHTWHQTVAFGARGNPAPVTLDCTVFALMCDAVEIYYTDSVNDEPDKSAEEAFAARLARLAPVTLTD